MTGSYVAPTLDRATVGKLGPAWLERQRGRMKPSGWRSYESAWRCHVAPRWGRVQIADVKFSDVQAWVAELSGKRGPVIVETAASVLRRILDDAVADRMLASNPARGVKLPRRSPRRNVYLTADQSPKKHGLTSVNAVMWMEPPVRIELFYKSWSGARPVITQVRTPQQLSSVLFC
jgi:hypothetical protein